MSTEHETYRILGNLETGMENIEKTLVSISSTLSQAVRDHAVTDSKAEKAHSRIDSILPPLNEAVANGNDWVETKKKARFIIIGSGIGGGLGGFSIGKAIASIGTLFHP